MHHECAGGEPGLLEEVLGRPVTGQGQGVDADMKQAVEWYRRAAERGHYPSQARLGYCYAKGLGMTADPIEAFVWLSAAAQHGVGLAMAELEADAEAAATYFLMTRSGFYNLDSQVGEDGRPGPWLNAVAYAGLGEAAFELGGFAEAIEWYSESLKPDKALGPVRALEQLGTQLLRK